MQNLEPLKVDDLVVVIKNIGKDPKFDKYIGRFATVEIIGEFNLISGPKDFHGYALDIAPDQESDHPLWATIRPVFAREELLKVKDLDQDEIEDFIDEVVEDEHNAMVLNGWGR
jgi:hypothetical protein